MISIRAKFSWFLLYGTRLSKEFLFLLRSLVKGYNVST